MLFITAVIRTKVTEPLGRGFEVVDGMYLTNDKQLIEKKVPRHARQFMGQEYLHLVDTGLVMYSEPAMDAQLLSPRRDVKALTDWLFMVRAFYQALWLVKDNASINELGFGVYINPVHNQPACCSNLIASAVTTASGEAPDTTFSLDELRVARHYFQTTTLPGIFHDLLRDQEKPGSVSPFAIRFGSAKGRSRIARFNYFVSGARGMEDVDGKISIYMTCLEIIFSTSATELTHKLAERVAFFLEVQPAKRKQVFNIIKSAYSIRSKIVHGDEVEASERIIEIAKQIDEIVRRVYLKILSDEGVQQMLEGDRNVVEEYMINLTLGVPNQPSSADTCEA
jgi:hypothetical protein